MLNQVDTKVPALSQLSGQATEQVQSLVDHVFGAWCSSGLGLIGMALLGALAYRFIVRRRNSLATNLIALQAGVILQRIFSLISAR